MCERGLQAHTGSTVWISLEWPIGASLATRHYFLVQFGDSLASHPPHLHHEGLVRYVCRWGMQVVGEDAPGPPGGIRAHAWRRFCPLDSAGRVPARRMGDRARTDRTGQPAMGCPARRPERPSCRMHVVGKARDRCGAGGCPEAVAHDPFRGHRRAQSGRRRAALHARTRAWSVRSVDERERRRHPRRGPPADADGRRSQRRGARARPGQSARARHGIRSWSPTVTPARARR